MLEVSEIRDVSVRIPRDIAGAVLKISGDMGLNSSQFGAECVKAILEMMDQETPTEPVIVAQYKKMKATGSLRSQLSVKPLK